MLPPTVKSDLSFDQAQLLLFLGRIKQFTIHKQGGAVKLGCRRFISMLTETFVCDQQSSGSRKSPRAIYRCRQISSITMENWRSHVRARLQQRDLTEKHPYVGVFTSLTQLEERFEVRKQILDDVHSKNLGGVEVGKNSRLLQLQLRESEHLAEKLSQTVSDLTTVLYLKEAELQYWQSRVSQFRQEALSLAKGSKTMKATLSEFEFTVECQSKELAALCADQRGLKEALAQARGEKEELLQRWMDEKREEADRLNKYNDTQERWQRLAKQLRKHLHRGEKVYSPTVTSSWSCTTETSPSVSQDQ